MSFAEFHSDAKSQRCFKRATIALRHIAHAMDIAVEAENIEAFDEALYAAKELVNMLGDYRHFWTGTEGERLPAHGRGSNL